MITLISQENQIRYDAFEPHRKGVLVIAKDFEKTAQRAGADVALYYDNYHSIELVSYQGNYIRLTWHHNPYSGPAKTIKTDMFCLSPFYMKKAMDTMKQCIKDMKAGNYES